MSERMDTCGSCRFFKSIANQCRRHAPQVISETSGAMSDSVRSTVWPVTVRDEWCGDFQAWRG